MKEQWHRLFEQGKKMSVNFNSSGRGGFSGEIGYARALRTRMVWTIGNAEVVSAIFSQLKII